MAVRKEPDNSHIAVCTYCFKFFAVIISPSAQCASNGSDGGQKSSHHSVQKYCVFQSLCEVNMSLQQPESIQSTGHLAKLVFVVQISLSVFLQTVFAF